MSDTFEASVARLAAEAGLPGAFTLEEIPGGGNNRVYRLTGAGRDLFVKSYFYAPADTRDRLGAEFPFAQFLWRQGIRCIPRPIACDGISRVALFEFVRGRHLAAGDITRDIVSEALSFFQAINTNKEDPAAKGLPRASEAFFSVTEHLDGVGRRVQKLAAVRPETEIDREAAELVVGRLLPAWAQVRKGVEEKIGNKGEGLGSELDPADRCLSPSDFGFHNCLRSESGSLIFHDFEYAGWDDPAKTTGDFFSQVQVPVSMEHWEAFAGGVASLFHDPGFHRRRMDLLLPVYRIKHCCIVLNEFQPEGLARRKFSRMVADVEGRKRMQLAKARVILSPVPTIAYT